MWKFIKVHLLAKAHLLVSPKQQNALNVTVDSNQIVIHDFLKCYTNKISWKNASTHLSQFMKQNRQVPCGETQKDANKFLKLKRASVNSKSSLNMNIFISSPKNNWWAWTCLWIQINLRYKNFKSFILTKYFYKMPVLFFLNS